MKTAKDLTGKVFGKLIVIKKVGTDKKYNTQWLCKCECGNEKIVARDKLIIGHTTSCGCARKNFFKNLNKIHGLSHSRLWYVWYNIKNRCYRNTSKYYKYYGGRGITMCKEWLDDYQNFYNWAIKNGYDETAPKGACTIDRIDVNGNYEPNNCRWISMREQSRNKRNNKRISYNGETHCLKEWAEILSVDYKKLRDRMYKHNNFEKVITTLKG